VEERMKNWRVKGTNETKKMSSEISEKEGGDKKIERSFGL